MLTLQTPNYRPPARYNIWADPNFGLPNAAYDLYELIETLRGTGWERQLGQYSGAKLPQWAGELGDDFENALDPATLKFILPRDAIAFPGFMTQYVAFHTDIGPLVFCFDPWDSRLGRAEWLTGCTHELFECLTDWAPGTGWVDTAAGDEGADTCENLASLSLPSFQGCISSYWSNELGRCLTQGDI